MPWARIDDQFPDHPKVIGAGPLAELLHVRAICYANRHLTDGVIPAGIVPRLAHDFDRLTLDGTDARSIDWAGIMLKHGLWEPHGDGYRIHDFLVYNLAKADVLAMRESRSRAGRLGGQASAEARASRFGSRDPRANASRGASPVKQVLQDAVKQNGNPVPSTTTTTSPRASAHGSASASPVPWKEKQALEDQIAEEHPSWSARQVEDEALRQLAGAERGTA